MPRKNPTSPFIIYALTEADCSVIRYVGMSSSGMKRPRQHVAPSIAASSTGPKGIWVRSLLTNGKRPGVRILQECATAAELGPAEALWIASLRAVGTPLLNVVDGGLGRGHGPALNSTREKVRAALQGRPKSDAHRRAIGAASTGRQHSVETRAKMSAAKKGRVFTPEHRAKIAAGVRAAKARAKEVGNAP